MVFKEPVTKGDEYREGARTESREPRKKKIGLPYVFFDFNPNFIKCFKSIVQPKFLRVK
jgi:hypothetical protein